MSITLDQISKHYGRQLVVDNVSLSVEDGELFVLLGASGSGKSTVLRIIAGLTPADTGRVLLRNRDVTHLPPQERDLGLVFQNYSIFRHMTVAENIEFGLKVRKVPRGERVRRRQELLDLVGLISLGDRLPSQLSGGQQQRVALARALAYQPKVLLLDEPFGALDVKIRSQLRRSLRKIQQRLHVTTILVTHDQDEAFELADRIGVIEKGRLLEVARSEDLYYRPRSSFVATFVGGGTVIVGRVHRRLACFGHLSLPLPNDLEVEDDARVQLLVRPEHVVLSASPPANPEHLVGEGPIVEEYFSGSLRRARLRLPRLSGTRQIAPSLPFGEDALLMDAFVPADRALEKKSWHVALRDWHIIKAPPLRMLILHAGRTGADVPIVARWMIEKLEASATLLCVGADSSIPAVEEISWPGLESRHVEVKVRRGNLTEELFAELSESLYDMAVLGCEKDPPDVPVHGVCAQILGKLLQIGSLPVLIVRGASTAVSGMLICTAGGEPGKYDVREGGRLARRFGVPVEVLHVARLDAQIDSLARLHVDRAAATLRSLDLAVHSTILQQESISSAIISRARETGVDMIVVGAHVEHSRFLGGADIAREVIDRADRPVLVIPAEERQTAAPDVLPDIDSPAPGHL